MEEENKVKVSKFFERITQWDKKTRILLAAGLLGMGLLLLSEIMPPNKTSDKKTSADISQSQSDDDSKEYIRDMEERLKGILEKIDGAGSCEVMITLKQGTRWVYASEDKISKDISRDSNTSETVKSTDKNTSEGKLVFIEDGDGNRKPVVETKLEPQINGVVVVCEGGKSQVVCQRVTEAVKTVLGVGTNQIFVTPKG